MNFMNWVNWPDVDLPVCLVKLSSRSKIKIVPHFKEPDFEALISRRLSYQREVALYFEGRDINYDAIVDIGANAGLKSLLFFSLTKGPCDIFAFEPSRETYSRLLKNIKINAAYNIHTFNVGIGEKTDFYPFYEPEGHLTNGSLDRKFAEIFSLRIMVSKILVLSSQFLLNLLRDRRKVLIKVDTEGNDFFILRSLEGFIRERKPEIMVEVLSIYEERLNSLEFLTSSYILYNITDHGPVRYEKFKGPEGSWMLLPK
jgi:FkbM family methyltransferase